MDKRTLDLYEAKAAEFAQLYRTVTPTDLYRQLLAFFHPEELTADIGGGSGRDAAWLADQGFPTTGYDASPAMLEQARAAYGKVDFQQAALPDLAEIPDGAFKNVLCSGTFMHIGREHLITAVINLARIMRQGGRLVVSYRESQGETEREADGRLFTPIPAGKLALLFEAAGLEVVRTMQQPDTFRPGIGWVVILAEKSPAQSARGLERVQSVLAQDKKDATYKFALIRALCQISRTQPHVVVWGAGEVYVPLSAVAVLWLEYYWPFLTHPEYVAQKRGERPGSEKQITFRRMVERLSETYTPGGLHALLQDIEEGPERFRQPLKKIRDAIKDGPIRHAGTHSRVFDYRGIVARGRDDLFGGRFGWMAVPESIWLDISRFNHWIEDSLILRWAQLTAEVNPGSTAADYIPLLLKTVTDERETAEVRGLLTSLGTPLQCVWSGEELKRDFQVDHLIPYSVWGNNHWWNLLPAGAQVNRAKLDALPTRRLLLKRREPIVEYWRIYRRHRPASFERQMSHALGVAAGAGNWEGLAFAGLQEAVERVAATRGLKRWEL
ncbi:MAG: methyltransferase domain-containing protein [Bacillota bacterium]